MKTATTPRSSCGSPSTNTSTKSPNHEIRSVGKGLKERRQEARYCCQVYEDIEAHVFLCEKVSGFNPLTAHSNLKVH